MSSTRGAGGIVGVGVDTVEVLRLRLMVGRRPGLADRLFTPREQAYIAQAHDPIPRMATRFAAKEAVMKALGVGLGAFRFTDVEVARIGLDAPTLVVSGQAADLARQCGVARWHLSLTHTDQVATAFVVAEGAPAEASPAAEPELTS